MYITAGRAEEHDARECSVAACGSDFGKLRHLYVLRACPFAAMLTFHFANHCNFPWTSFLRSGKAAKVFWHAVHGSKARI